MPPLMLVPLRLHTMQAGQSQLDTVSPIFVKLYFVMLFFARKKYPFGKDSYRQNKIIAIKLSKNDVFKRYLMSQV